MPTLAETLSEDRRLLILQALDQAPGYKLADGTLRTVLDHAGHRIGRDVMRGDISWLVQNGMVRMELLGDGEAAPSVWLVTLKEPGQAVAQGRFYPGVKRPEAT